MSESSELLPLLAQAGALWAGVALQLLAHAKKRTRQLEAIRAELVAVSDRIDAIDERVHALERRRTWSTGS